MLKAAVIELEIKTLDACIIFTVAHLVAELELCILAVTDAYTVDSVYCQNLIRYERRMVAAADDEGFRADLLCPLDIFYAVGKCGRSYGETDDIEFTCLAQPSLEILLCMKIQQMQQPDIVSALL